MKYKAPGKRLLQVVGIILIVLGVFGLISAVINWGNLGQMKTGTLDAMTQSLYEQMGVTEETLQTSAVTSCINGLLFLVSGILGVMFCNKTQKAGICFLCGILLIAWVLLSAGYSAIIGGFGILNVFGILFNLILPLLYFWGAQKNRQANMEGQ